ncbi:MAG: MerR family DNA-binding transcriptional regulator, partial [Patescibacteria group bacterium]|nr:MerR family DNA-binding transcriptional regulator [Patescibacteria group bacterium]
MATNLPKDKNIVPIREASQILGVSIDTIRRWDKDGTLHSQRPNGKDRYFSINELEKVKLAKPLTISEVSARLNMSQSTLRRLEKKGFIVPQRDENGERIYTQKALQDFLASSYFLRKNDVEEKILQSLSSIAPTLEKKEEKNTIVQQVPVDEEMPVKKKDVDQLAQEIEASNNKVIAMLGTSLVQQDKKIKNITFVRRVVAITLAVFLLVSISITAILSYLFLKFPEQTAKFFAETNPQPQFVAQEQKNTATVLAATTGPQPGILHVIGATVLRPYAAVSLQVVKQIKPETYAAVAPQVAPPATTGNAFTVTQNGQLVPQAPIVVTKNGTTGTNLVIQDKDIIANLNADFVRNRKPGTKTGDLAYFSANGVINGLYIPTASNSAGLSAGIITTDYLADNSVTSAKIVDGTIVAADIASGTLTGTQIASDANIPDSSLAQLTSSNKVAGSAIALASGGGLTNNAGLSLSTSCSANQTLVWNGSSWACGTTSSGTITGVTAGNGLSGGGTSGSVSLAVAVPTSGTSANTSSNSGLEVASDGVSLLRGCSDSQVLTWNGTSHIWQCANQTGGGGGGIATIQEGGSNVVTSATTLNFGSSDFDVTNGGAGTGTIAIDYSNSHIAQTNTAETISSKYTFSSATPLAFSNTAPSISIGNTGTLSITDGTNTLLSLADSGTTGTLTVNAANISGLTASKVVFTDSSKNLTSSGTVGVGQGGTGVGTFGGTNTLLYTSAADSLGSLTAGTNGQILVGNTAGAPSFVTLGSDATINSGTGALTLATSGVTANSYGSATSVPTFTVDSKGRLTAASNTTISGLTASNLTAGDFSSVINTGTYGINISGSAGSATSATSATNATNSTNVGTTATSGNADFYPLFVASSSNSNQASSLNSAFTFHPSTGVLTATTFSGALSGNASTATKLATARAINGVSFDGTADITVAAAAGTLTGTSLASNVVSSSLTSVGTLVSGTHIDTATFTNHTLTDSGALTLATTGDNNLTLTPGGVGTVVVNPNAGGQASLIIANQGSGDLLTASAGATPKFTVKANGNVVGTGSLSGFTIAAGSNTISGLTASNLTAGDFSGAITSGTYSINVSGSAGSATSATTATTATNATNIATTAKSDNITYYPLFVGSSSNGNQAADLGTGLTFNPSSNTLSTTTFSGALSGNATTATTLQNARNINGISFNGSGDITVAAAAGTLTGTTLASNVVSSSLTSVGTLVSGTKIGSQTFTTNNIADSGSLTIASGGVGNLTLNSAGGTLTSNATTVNFGSAALTVSSCTGCGGGSGSSNWTINTNGTIYPINTTLDILGGGSATTSAKFSVLNMTGSGNPTASVSSGLNGVGAYLTSTGVLGATSRQTLALGDSSTGAITIGSDNNSHNITIGNASSGDLALNDAQWSITGAGVGTLASLNTGSGSIVSTGTIGSASNSTFTG